MEKGLTYFDLAENDYQFLLKDWQDGRINTKGFQLTKYEKNKTGLTKQPCLIFILSDHLQ